jgi:hypothetical protein
MIIYLRGSNPLSELKMYAVRKDVNGDISFVRQITAENFDEKAPGVFMTKSLLRGDTLVIDPPARNAGGGYAVFEMPQ